MRASEQFLARGRVHGRKTASLYGKLAFFRLLSREKLGLTYLGSRRNSNNDMRRGRAPPARARPSRTLIFAKGENANESILPHQKAYCYDSVLHSENNGVSQRKFHCGTPLFIPAFHPQQGLHSSVRGFFCEPEAALSKLSQWLSAGSGTAERLQGTQRN